MTKIMTAMMMLVKIVTMMTTMRRENEKWKGEVYKKLQQVDSQPLISDDG